MQTIKRLPYETNRPVLYSFNNNWVGQEMHTMSEYCLIIDNINRQKYARNMTIDQIKNFEFKT